MILSGFFGGSFGNLRHDSCLALDILIVRISLYLPHDELENADIFFVALHHIPLRTSKLIFATGLRTDSNSDIVDRPIFAPVKETLIGAKTIPSKGDIAPVDDAVPAGFEFATKNGFSRGDDGNIGRGGNIGLGLGGDRNIGDLSLEERRRIADQKISSDSDDKDQKQNEKLIAVRFFLQSDF